MSPNVQKAEVAKSAKCANSIYCRLLQSYCRPLQSYSYCRPLQSYYRLLLSHEFI